MMNSGNYRSFEKARKASEASDYKVHVGSVLVYKNKIIATGCNSCKTHPDQMVHNRFREIQNEQTCIHSVHAEMKALNSVKRNLDEEIDWSKVKIFIYRGCKSRKTGIARPCPACMAKIKEKGIKHIFYTTDDGFAHEILEY